MRQRIRDHLSTMLTAGALAAVALLPAAAALATSGSSDPCAIESVGGVSEKVQAGWRELNPEFLYPGFKDPAAPTDEEIIRSAQTEQYISTMPDGSRITREAFVLEASEGDTITITTRPHQAIYVMEDPFWNVDDSTIGTSDDDYGNAIFLIPAPEGRTELLLKVWVYRSGSASGIDTMAGCGNRAEFIKVTYQTKPTVNTTAPIPQVTTSSPTTTQPQQEDAGTKTVPADTTASTVITVTPPTIVVITIPEPTTPTLVSEAQQAVTTTTAAPPPQYDHHDGSEGAA